MARGDWNKDPDGTYRKTCKNLEKAFQEGIISGSECGIGKGVAAECRDRAKKENRIKEAGK